VTSNPGSAAEPVRLRHADGPVYIPKIYNGRDKTFFMANYEGWRMNNGQSIREVVPTRGGTFRRFYGDDASSDQ
jgi:hypothetical protein